MSKQPQLSRKKVKYWDDEEEIRPPKEGDMRSCPECGALCEWVNMGNPQEGAFWSCECGYESTQEELCSLHWIGISECGCAGSLEK